LNSKFMDWKTINFKKVLLPLVVILLLISNGATAYYIYQQKAGKKDVSVKDNFADNKESGDSADIAKNEDQNPAGDEFNQENSQNNPNQPLITDDADGDILVDWYEWPQEIWKGEELTENTRKALNGEKLENFTGQEEEYNLYSIYKTGTIAKGPYKDKGLYLLIVSEMGESFERFIKDGDRLVLLSDTNFSDNFFILNDKIEISNLNPPAKIKIPGSDISLKAADDSWGGRFYQEMNDLTAVFSYSGDKKIYVDKNYCFWARNNDGTLRAYDYELPFAEEKGVGEVGSRLDIIWSGGKRSEFEYETKKIGGCGAYCYDKYEGEDSDLDVIGATGNGDKIYGFKDVNSKEAGTILKPIYDNYYPSFNENAKIINDKISYTLFSSGKPVIFWKDPFGNYLLFLNIQFLPAVECGKPVIYLYPERQSDVSVKVHPAGGFKLTEPAYNNGWLVSASPEGQIYNYGDGKNYNYLFWEGYGLNYRRPREGFVVAREDVKSFLGKALYRQGLIKKEADEFIDFWEPRMRDKNYYFITFVPQKEFDRLAPLEVSPRPDTVIRVFMDFEGLDEKIRAPEQRLAGKERIGFTVVEWGGAIH